jgi:hypothetical protein
MQDLCASNAAEDRWAYLEEIDRTTPFLERISELRRNQVVQMQVLAPNGQLFQEQEHLSCDVLGDIRRLEGALQAKLNLAVPQRAGYPAEDNTI